MRILTSILFVAFAGFSVIAQDNSVPFEKSLFKERKEEFKIAMEHMEKANETYVNYPSHMWYMAIDDFEAAQAFNPKNAELNYKLGDCYLHSVTKSKSLSYFLEAYKLNPAIQMDIHYKLGRGYHLSSKFQDALKEYKIHLTKIPAGKEAAAQKKYVEKLIRECETALEMIKNPIRVWVDNLGKEVNSPHPDYAAQIAADESRIIFTSRRPSEFSDEMINGMYNEDVYISERDEKGNWTKAQLISKTINVKDNDAISGLSPDGNTIFVYYHSGSDGGNLYQSVKTEEGWSKPKDLGKNVNTSKSWDTDASLSYDGKRLYFVSDKEGTMGGRDVWYSDWDAKKEMWGPSTNMGAPINTEYDEVGIFMHPDGKTMYFSSNGQKGMGGFDIYSSEMKADSTWSAPVNIGYPVSTPDDDVFFTVSASGIHGYYASFREDGEGEKDLYMITFLGKPKEPLTVGEDNLIASITKPIEEEIVQAKLEVSVKNLSILKGKVLDADTKKPLVSQVELTDNVKNTQVSSLTTDGETGKFLMSLPAGKNYGIAVKSEGYLFHSENFDIPADAGYQEYEKIILMKKVKVGESIVLRNIFFDLDKYSLKDESKTELDRLYQLLVDNPTLVIEISGHTDTQGSAAYNMQLSEDRAKAVVDYLVAYGIGRERFEHKGYGESKPMISDAEIAKMKSQTQKDEANGMNRRTEFKILQF